jgi:hypothetical protein
LVPLYGGSVTTGHAAALLDASPIDGLVHRPSGRDGTGSGGVLDVAAGRLQPAEACGVEER